MSRNFGDSKGRVYLVESHRTAHATYSHLHNWLATKLSSALSDFIHQGENLDGSRTHFLPFIFCAERNKLGIADRAVEATPKDERFHCFHDETGILPRNTITIQRESSKKNKSGRAKPLAPSPSIGMLRCTMDGEAQRWSLHPQSANGGGIPCTMADPPFPAQTTTIPFLNCLPSSSTIYYPCPPHSVFTLAWQEVFPNRK